MRRNGGWPSRRDGTIAGTLYGMASAAVPALNDDPLADDTGSLLAPAPTGSFQRPVRIFEHEPDLLAALSSRASRLAWHLGVAESTIFEEGDWSPPDRDELGPGALGLLVLDGVLTRSVGFDHRRTPELIGAGDLLRPWEADPVAGLVSVRSEWKVMQRATIALLDEQFAHRLCRVPGVSAALLARAFQRVRWSAFHAALAQVRRAQPRLLLLFWHMADRWGRVTPEGIHLPLNLTHGFLASLVCMRRPTVSAALVALARDGQVCRREDRTWLLTGAPPQLECIHEPRTQRSSR